MSNQGKEHLLEAIAEGDLVLAERIAREALEEALAASDLENVAKMHLAVLGLARARQDRFAVNRALRQLEAHAASYPGSAVEVAYEYAKALLLLEAQDVRGAISTLRRATLRDSIGGEEGGLGQVVLPELLIASAKRRVTDQSLAKDLAAALMAVGPAELVVHSLIDYASDPSGDKAFRIALEAERAGRHEKSAWAYVTASVASIRNGQLEQAVMRLKEARSAAVHAAEPIAYSVASFLLFVLYLALLDPINAVATAMRAKASLDDLLGPGGGDEFKALLELLRLAVGDETFRSYVQQFINARESGAM